MKPTGRQPRILEMLARKPATTVELAAELGGSRAATRAALNALSHGRKIRHDGRGKPWVLEDGVAAEVTKTSLGKKRGVRASRKHTARTVTKVVAAAGRSIPAAPELRAGAWTMALELLEAREAMVSSFFAKLEKLDQAIVLLRDG